MTGYQEYVHKLDELTCSLPDFRSREYGESFAVWNIIRNLFGSTRKRPVIRSSCMRSDTQISHQSVPLSFLIFERSVLEC